MYKGVTVRFRYKGIFGLSDWVATVHGVNVTRRMECDEQVTKENAMSLLFDGKFKLVGNDLKVMSQDGVWYELDEIEFV